MTFWLGLTEDEQAEILKDATVGGETEVICPDTKPFNHDCGCYVAHAGHCSHGCPSVLLVAGII